MADRESLKRLVVSRQSALESKRNLWDGIWQEVADFVIPIREDILGTLLPGQKQGQRIYDGTAVGAAQLYADGVHSHLFSRVSPWFSLLSGDDEIDSIKSVRQWFQDVASHLYIVLSRSNFYDMSWQFIYDGGVIGTAVMYAEPDDKTSNIVWEAIHPGECYIEENVYGYVDTLHRKRKLTAKQAIERFGIDNVPEAIKTQYNLDPYKESEWIHAVYPRQDYDDRSALATKKRFASVWMSKEGGHIAQESGYDEFPYAVWRFMKCGKAAYGRSNAMLAIVDIKKANIISKTLLGAAQISVDPPWNIPSEMRDNLQLMPGGRNHYTNELRLVSRINTNINYPIGTDREERVQAAIERHFKTQYFLLLTQSERAKTATEALEIKAELANVLGPMVGRLNNEGSDKFIDMAFNIEWSAGRIPPPPPELIERQGQPIQINYMGPLAQAQRRLFATQGIRSGLETVAPIFELSPGSMDIVNWDETVKDLLNGNGFPAKNMNDETDVEMLRTQRAKAQQQQQAMAMMMEGAKPIKDIVEADVKSGGKLSKAVMGAV